jgi:hypothetical protein
MDCGVLIILKIYSMMRGNAQVLHLLLDFELVPGPVVEDAQDTVNLPRLKLFVLVEKTNTAKIKVAPFWSFIEEGYHVTAVYSLLWCLHLSEYHFK